MTLVHEDEEKKVYRDEGGTEGEVGHWVSELVEWKSGYETTDERIDQDFRAAVSNAASVAELKDALLGSNSGGRVGSQPSNA